MSECLNCGGTGRGAFGGPCRTCDSTGQTGAFIGAVQLIGACLIIGFILYAVIH